jgi:hypothetical protein
VNKEKVSSVAKQLGISTQAVYKKLAKVGNQIDNHLIKENGVTYLTDEGIELLRATLQAKPQEDVSPVGNLVATLQKSAEEKQTIIDKQQSLIEQLVCNQTEERQRSDTIIMKLSNDLGNMRVLLEETKKTKVLLSEPLKPIKPWEPPVKIKNPLDNKSWLQKVWVKFFEPWKMRQQPY